MPAHSQSSLFPCMLFMLYLFFHYAYFYTCFIIVFYVIFFIITLFAMLLVIILNNETDCSVIYRSELRNCDLQLLSDRWIWRVAD